MTPHTLHDIFFAIVERKHERLMLVREGSRWTSISSQEFYRISRALEAGISNYASPYTDSNAMPAIRLVFKYLPVA